MAATRPRKRVKGKADIFLPDDLIIEILSRLPAKRAVRCRIVCRRWRDLTSTVDFMELHMRRSIPMILVVRSVPLFPNYRAVSKSSYPRVISNFLLDKWWEPKRERLTRRRFLLDLKETGRCSRNVYRAKFSHGGLVVFRKSSGPLFDKHCRREFLILNPTSYENVKITPSKELWGSKIYGIFFNPSLEEYCTLWRLDLGGEVYYKMLNLGSKPCWREISNPWSHRDKVEETCPVLVDKYLYWLVDPDQEYGYGGRGDIMVFDIRSETFSLIHWPIPSDVHCEDSRISLLDIGGALSIVMTSHIKKEFSLSIWKLEDVKKQLWIHMKHSIRVEDCSRSKVSRSKVSRATVVAGEKLALWLDERLYVCDLRLGTTSSKKKYKKHNDVVTSSHVMSLASLKNCKSVIYIDKEGEVRKESTMT